MLISIDHRDGMLYKMHVHQEDAGLDIYTLGGGPVVLRIGSVGEQHASVYLDAEAFCKALHDLHEETPGLREAVTVLADKLVERNQEAD